MSEGRVVEYIDQREIVLSVCLKHKGGKLHLLTSSNHEVSISSKRALLISSTALDISRSREDLLGELRAVENRRIDYMAKVPVQELWELTHEEDDRFSFQYLAQLCFGTNVSDDHISALVRALFADRVYFKMKVGCFVPHSPDKVEQISKARQAAAIREREINEGARWLREVINNRHLEGPPLKERVIEILIQLALYGKDAPDFKLGKELFSRAGVKDMGQARHLLVKLGVWREDENLDLHRVKIRTDFSEPCLREAETVMKKRTDQSGRQDLTDLPIFTIDGPFTRDYDDALSLQPLEHGYRLGVHITDIAPFIEIDGRLDAEASARATSIYLPANQIPMLPPSLSNNVLSLLRGCRRLSISLSADFDSEWNLTHYRFVPSIVRVERQLTYDQVNTAYADDPVFSTLYQLSKALRQKRVANGALLIPLPEIHFEFDNNSPVQIRLVGQDTPAKIMVSECMILYNWLAARFASETALPILYRAQEPAQERLSQEGSNYVYYVFQQRRRLQPLSIDTKPQPHSSLGVDVYTNATSPLRRYLDLLVQRQIHGALLEKGPVYTGSRLQEVSMGVQQKLKDIELMNTNRIRYWILKYLARRINERFNALVFQKMRHGHLVILIDFLFVADLQTTGGPELSGGQEIKVVVKKSDPWNDVLILELAD